MRTSKYSLYTVVFVSLLFSFLYCPLFDIFFDDKEFFKYGSFLMKKGSVPYKDFFDHKPPLIFFVNYIGSIFDDWGLWIFDALLVLFASLQFFKLNKKYNIKYPAVLPILFNLILRNYMISFGVGMTREYTTILLLLAFCVIFLDSRHKHFILGLITAFVFFLQQEQVFILLPFLVYDFYIDRQKNLKIQKSILYFIAGTIFITVPLFLYFFFNNALNDVWQCAFVFNRKWYTQETNPSLIRQLITIKNYLYSLNFDTLILAALIMAAIAFIVGHERKMLLSIGLLGLPLSLISEFLSAKLTNGNALVVYYFLPLAATIPILFFIVFAFTSKNVFKSYIHQFIYGALLIGSLIMDYAEYVANYYKYPQDSIARSSEIRFLDHKAIKDYELYVFGSPNYIYAYNRFKIISPSRWIYHNFWRWYPNWDTDGQILQSIMTDLQTHRTEFVIYDPDVTPFAVPQNKMKWESFLNINYQKLPGLIVYERKF